MATEEHFAALDRRSLIRGAILLVGGSIAVTPEQLVAAPAAKTARFFSPARMAVLAEVAETIIPRTDTPGAKDAGVHQSFDGLMRNWASAEHQLQFSALLDEFAGAGLMKLPASDRVDLVRKMDAQKLGAGDRIYARFKELILTLYYLSEAGATKELRYELVPGKWEPWTEVTPETRAWAV